MSGDKFNLATALTALGNYRTQLDSLTLSRDIVYREFQAIYGNDNEAARLAVNRIARNEPRPELPVSRVVRELELLIACHDIGIPLLDG